MAGEHEEQTSSTELVVLTIITITMVILPPTTSILNSINNRLGITRTTNIVTDFVPLYFLIQDIFLKQVVTAITQLGPVTRDINHTLSYPWQYLSAVSRSLHFTSLSQSEKETQVLDEGDRSDTCR